MVVASTGARTKDERKAAFLCVLAEVGNISIASEILGEHAPTTYRWRREDAAFDAAWKTALAGWSDICPRCHQRQRKVPGAGRS